MTYNGTPNGESVLVPTGSNYYVVITSDTGNAQVKKWDTTQVSTVGSVSWEDFFSLPFAAPGHYDTTKTIDSGGISLAFTVPVTSSPYLVVFTTVGLTSISTTRTGSVNQTVGDYTSAPTETWGFGTISGGINYSGTEIMLVPGETYFFNIRNDSPTGTNQIRIQTDVVAQ